MMPTNTQNPSKKHKNILNLLVNGTGIHFESFKVASKAVS